MQLDAPQGGLPQRRRRLRHRFRPLTVLLGGLLVLVGAAAVVAGGPRALLLDTAGLVASATFHDSGGVRAAPGPGSKRAFTVLVMGTEKTRQFGGMQTDSMMVWAYDPQAHRAAIISVPRDLWVDIPGYGYQRINSALEFRGPQVAEQTVSRVLGIPIDYYAIVDYDALIKLVNALGGVRVYVPYSIDDHCFPNAAENACTTFKLSKGWHVLNGVTALKFAREREVLPLSDISRDTDQQALLLALRAKLLSPLSLFRIPGLVSIVRGSVMTNFPWSDVPRVAAAVLRLPSGAIGHVVLQYSNGAVSNWVTPGGADVLLPNSTAIHQVLAQVLGPILPALEGGGPRLHAAGPAVVNPQVAASP